MIRLTAAQNVLAWTPPLGKRSLAPEQPLGRKPRIMGMLQRQVHQPICGWKRQKLLSCFYDTDNHQLPLPGELMINVRGFIGYMLLVYIFVVFGGFNKEIGMAGTVNKCFRQCRGYPVKFGNTDNLLDQIPGMATPKIQLVFCIHKFQ